MPETDLAVTGSPPALPAADPGPTLDEAVVAEDFSRPSSVFTTGTAPVGNGTSTRSVSDGRYRMVNQGVGPGFTVWEPVSIPAVGRHWSVSTTTLTDAGSCGLMVGDGSTSLAAVLDRTTGEGIVRWFAEQPLASVPFSTSPGESQGSLSVTMNDGDLSVSVDGVAVTRIRDKVLGTPAVAGLATHGDEQTCDFDDFTVRKPS